MQTQNESETAGTQRSRVYSCGTGPNRATIRVEGDVLRIDVTGDSLDEGIVDCFRTALADGAIRLNMLCLIDLSDFAGRFDWSTIHAIVQLAPWGSEAGRESRVAYVTKSAWFSAMMKVTSVLFPRTEHRQFSSAFRALQWLHAQKAQ